MRVTSRITPMRQQIDVVIRNTMSMEAQAAKVAAHARERLAEAQDANRQSIGRVPPHETFVNGSKSERLEDVRPGKSIVFRFDLVTDLFLWIAAQLETHSPKLKGAYSKSHVFYADSTEADPANPPEADEYVFLSLSPYARKIERGHSKQAPDGVYEALATMANRRYGNLGRITFSYRSPLLSYVAGGANRAERKALRNQPARQRAMIMERISRVPAIIIRL